MNLVFLERKTLELFSARFTSDGRRAATSAPHALAKHLRRPSADAPRRLPVVWPAHWLPATIRIALWRAVCSSIRNAGDAIAAAGLVRVTHPFHPLSGRQFACVGERCNRYGKRLLLRVDDAAARSIPPQWTDLVPPDPEIVMGGNRALFRVADLLELAELVEELSRRKSSSGSNVRRTMPHV